MFINLVKSLHNYKRKFFAPKLLAELVSCDSQFQLIPWSYTVVKKQEKILENVTFQNYLVREASQNATQGNQKLALDATKLCSKLRMRLERTKLQS